MNGEDFREEMVSELERMWMSLFKFKKEHEDDLYTTEYDLLYEAMVSLSDFEDALNETLGAEDIGGEQI